MKELLPPYETGRQDGVSADGDVVFVDVFDHVRDAKEARYSELAERNAQDGEPGAYITIEERRRALGDLASAYAGLARADGLARHTGMPQPRPNYDASVAENLAKLLRSEELLAAGFSERGVSAARRDVIDSIRESFGVDAGAKKRNTNLRRASVVRVQRPQKR
jgi:hypothetical protein